MSLQSTKEIERLIDDYLSANSGNDWVVFHFNLGINECRDDFVSGDVVYHGYPLNDVHCYPHTNIHKFVLESNADFEYFPDPLKADEIPSIEKLTVRKNSSCDIAVEEDCLGDWEFACFLNQISKEECGQLLFEAFGAKEKIDYLSYPERIRQFLDEAFDTYLQFESILERTMQKHGFS